MKQTYPPLPSLIFKTRVRDDSIEGPNPYRWQSVTTEELFNDKRVVVFSLPGAFTPTCDTYQLPGFEENFEKFQKLGIDAIYCISVNDAFVMNAWAKSQNIKNVQVIPDGNGDFTRMMGMMIQKRNLGFGMRSWRYAMVVDHGVIEHMFQEPGIEDNCMEDPYGETSPENIIKYLEESQSI